MSFANTNVVRTSATTTGAACKINVVMSDNEPMTCDQVLRILAGGRPGPREPTQEQLVRAMFAPFLMKQAAFFECRPMRGADLATQAFEYAVVDATDAELAVFAKSADASAFADKFVFASPHAAALAFSSVGGDSLLVAPVPGKTALEANANLGKFVRGAPIPTQIALWQTVAQNMMGALHSSPHAPLYLSTSGLAVSWLHVRIDRAPKYYHCTEWAAAHRAVRS